MIPMIEGRNDAVAATGAGFGLFMGAALFLVNKVANKAQYDSPYNNIKTFRDDAIRVFYATPT